MAGCWSPSGQRHPVHADRDLANEQAIAEPHAGHAISRNGPATCPLLWEIACREKRAHAEEHVFVLLVIGGEGVLVKQHQFVVIRARIRENREVPL